MILSVQNVLKYFILLAIVMLSTASFGYPYLRDDQNVSCKSFSSCTSCSNSVEPDCYWCSTDSTCVDQSNKPESCTSNLMGSCEESYLYTIIFMVVVSVLFVLCMVAYFMRKRQFFQNNNNDTSPQMLDRTRNFLFRNLLLNDGTPDWMCIICGFDNKPRNAHCIMCGTAHEFSKDYKTKKFETKRLKKELKEAKKAEEAKKKADIDIRIPQEAQITSISTSLRYFLSVPDGALSPDKRREALNYRRLNQLTLRQKSARRRKMWQRRIDPITGNLMWVRVPIHRTTVGSAPFGYTPRHSFAEYNEDDSYMSTSGTARETGNSVGTLLSSLLSGHSKERFNGDDPLSESLLSGSGRNSISDSVGNRSNMSHQSNLPLFDPVADLLAAAASPIGASRRDRRVPGLEGKPPRAGSKATGAPTFNSPRRRRSRDSFDDSVLASHSPGYTSVFDDEGELVWEKVVSGAPISSQPRRSIKNTATGENKSGGPVVIKYVSSTRGPYQQNNFFPRQQRLYQQPARIPPAPLSSIESADNSPMTAPTLSTGSGELDSGSIVNPLRSQSTTSAAPAALDLQNDQNDAPIQMHPVVGEFPRMTDEETGNASALRPLMLPNASVLGGGGSVSVLRNENTRPFSPFSCQSVDAGAEDVDLSTIASMTYRSKLLWFLDRLSEFQVPPNEGYIKIEIRRNRLLEDSHSVITQFQPEDLHKYMRIEFHGEPGVDAGGLEREWFALVTTELFKPETGLFTCSGGDALGAYHINPTSGSINPNHLSYFRFIGKFIGKAILGQQSINANFSVPLRKQMLSMPVTFSDLEFVDEELHRNLVWLKQNDQVSNLMLYFSISYPSADNKAPVEYELVPGGADIPVTDENKEEYLQLRLRHRLLDSIKPQLENLLIGLYEVVPADLLSVFDYQELDLLLCGVPDIDVKDWKEQTEYMGLYRKQGANHKVIKWFWSAVESMSHEERIRLLQYTTGCSRLPSQGFKALQSTDGRYRRFNIQSIYKTDSVYPRAHTCFNKLDLPLYESQRELDAYLSVVINMENMTGFTIE